MRAALAPIDAGVGETAAEASGFVEVNAECGKGFGSRGSKLAIVVPRSFEPIESGEAVMQGDTQSAGEMVVAGAGGAKSGRRIGRKNGAGTSGKYA